MNERIVFARKQGENITNRIAQDCLVGIQELLRTKCVKINGKLCKVKLHGTPRKRDGQWQIMLDVINPCNEIDHIEFIIRNTGWGMDL